MIFGTLIPIPGFPRYSVDRFGNVFSDRAGRFLKWGRSSNGYPTVCLGRGNTRAVHGLVALTFLGPTPPGQLIRHDNGDRWQPQLSNLLFGTHSENIEDAVRHGTWKGKERCAIIGAMRTPASFAKTWATRRERYGASGRS